MNIIAYEHGTAAELIDAERTYAAQNNVTEELSELRSIASGVSTVLGFTSNSLSLFTEVMATVEPDPKKRKIKIKIRNSASVILLINTCIFYFSPVLKKISRQSDIRKI